MAGQGVCDRLEAEHPRKIVTGKSRRGDVGKVLVAMAVLAPALLVVGMFLVMQSRMYGYHVHGPLWPWIAGDAAVLGIGLLLLRGEDV